MLWHVGGVHARVHRPGSSRVRRQACVRALFGGGQRGDEEKRREQPGCPGRAHERLHEVQPDREGIPGLVPGRCHEGDPEEEGQLHKPERDRLEEAGRWLNEKLQLHPSHHPQRHRTGNGRVSPPQELSLQVGLCLWRYDMHIA